MSCRDWILVTGQPSSGKTTAIRRLTRALQDAGFKVQGFYTEEVRSAASNGGTNSSSSSSSGGRGTREGFDIVTVPDGQRARLARKQGLPSHWPSTGSYRVDVDSIDQIAVPSLCTMQESNQHAPRNDDKDNDVIYILDEIGRMELHSEKFKQAVRNLLKESSSSSTTTTNSATSMLPQRLVGAVTAPRYGHRVAFCDEVTAQDGVQVHNLTKKTRDQVTQDLLDYIQTNWIDKKQDKKPS